MSGDVQLRIAAELPVDPVELAKLPAFERAKLYDQLEPLDFAQRQACEDAVRAAGVLGT